MTTHSDQGIRFCIRLPQTYCTAGPQAILDVAQAADELGLYGVSVQDHIIADAALSSCAGLHDQSGEIYEAETHSLATPISDPTPLGGHARATSASDVDIGLLAEVGAAITRGAALIQTTAAAPHDALPVPPTAPQTPETASLPSPVPLMYEMQPSLASQAVEVGKEVLVTIVCAAAGAVGGASAGENIGGDMALSSLGPLAVPPGQAAGRSIGRIVGGAAGAAAIRCPSRIRSSRSPSTSVRFAPEVVFAPQPVISRSSEFALAQSSVTSPPSQSEKNSCAIARIV